MFLRINSFDVEVENEIVLGDAVVNFLVAYCKVWNKVDVQLGSLHSQLEVAVLRDDQKGYYEEVLLLYVVDCDCTSY
jgi:hypothetical protein